MSDAGRLPEAQHPLTLAEKIAKSSQICFVEYDSELSELRVIFRSTRALYAYKNVPPEVWTAMQASDSLGSFLYRQIKNVYEFDKRQLTDEQVAMQDEANMAREAAKGEADTEQPPNAGERP